MVNIFLNSTAAEDETTNTFTIYGPATLVTEGLQSGQTMPVLIKGPTGAYQQMTGGAPIVMTALNNTAILPGAGDYALKKPAWGNAVSAGYTE